MLPSRTSKSCVVLRLFCLEALVNQNREVADSKFQRSRGLREIILFSNRPRKFTFTSHCLNRHSLRVPQSGADSRFSILFLIRFKAEFVSCQIASMLFLRPLSSDESVPLLFFPQSEPCPRPWNDEHTACVLSKCARFSRVSAE